MHVGLIGMYYNAVYRNFPIGYFILTDIFWGAYYFSPLHM